jgi:hypothetical protein
VSEGKVVAFAAATPSATSARAARCPLCTGALTVRLNKDQTFCDDRAVCLQCHSEFARADVFAREDVFEVLP